MAIATLDTALAKHLGISLATLKRVPKDSAEMVGGLVTLEKVKVIECRGKTTT